MNNMRFQGTMINPNTGKKEKIDTEAFDESPDIKIKPTDDGGGHLIGPSHQDYNDYPEEKLYVGEVELSDGTLIELISTRLPLGVKLVAKK